MGPPYITIRGAREHNLKNIDVQIPRDKFVVITGLSGSGKSTLAFDTIYAEGQRRYVESLSAYARQFLEQMDKPDVDVIDGLSPAISIEQKTTSRNPRSTVGTVTEIYDYYRLLFARIGVPHCYECGKPIQSQTVTQMVDRLNALPEGAKVAILAPIVRNRKGEYTKELRDLRKAGFVRVRVDGAVRDLADEIPLEKKKKHTIDLFVDRLVLRPNLGNRLADSLETALRYGHGIARVEVGMNQPHSGGEGGQKWGQSLKIGTVPISGETRAPVANDAFLLSEKAACIECGISYPEITPQMFSFNNPTGACAHCGGLGTKMYFDPDLIIPNPLLSLREGTIAPWHSTTSTYYLQVFQNLARHYQFDIYTPWKDLPERLRTILLHGSNGEEIRFAIERHGRRDVYTNPFRGVIPHLEQRYTETTSDWVREDIERFMNVRPCPTCQGARLRKESLHVKVQEITIAELTRRSVEASLALVNGWQLAARDRQIAARILKEIQERLTFLTNVGLGYLTIDRATATLSGGEGQRIRLASQIGSALMGVLYVLDEPSIGLHQRDNHRLLETLFHLRDLGNTVLVVEHDHDTIMAADHVIDLGPGAGVHGGRIVATGTPQEIARHADSLTGHFLSGRRTIPLPEQRRRCLDRRLTVRGARQHNLKRIDVAFPIGCLTCITGVSGSGKSTLINETLYPAMCQRLYRSKVTAGACDGIEGTEHFDKVINIDQSPIGRTPRSNPATYTGVFGPIRDLFAELPVAKARGYKPGRFSFNVKGGRCEACEGDGILRIEMQFLPDVFVACEVCRGKRFNRETLEIAYKGVNIAEVLAMTVEQAAQFFEPIPVLRHKLRTLLDVGLGYIELGQSATTLSGGEAQRVKLSRELAKRATGRTLYILDEPTTGLHFADIASLLAVLHRLTDAGNTVIVIEHNLEVIKCADYVVDLGPEGGDRGGEVVASGTPEDLTRIPASYTGRYLHHVLYPTRHVVPPPRALRSARP